MNSTKSATCFQSSGFKSNDFKPSDQYPSLKKLSQVTNCIKPNDFKPNGIKPSDHLPKNQYYSAACPVLKKKLCLDYSMFVESKFVDIENFILSMNVFDTTCHHQQGFRVPGFLRNRAGRCFQEQGTGTGPDPKLRTGTVKNLWNRPGTGQKTDYLNNLMKIKTHCVYFV